MARTGSQLLQALSEFLDDWFSSTTTSAGNTGGTTLIDTALKQFGDNRLTGRYVHIPGTPAVRRSSGNTQSTGTLTVAQAFAAQVAGSTAYQVHRYDPAKKFLALDKARLNVLQYLFQVKLDDTTTGDGRTRVFDVPSVIEQGPHIAYLEDPAPIQSVTWNFLTSPLGDATTGWTALSLTASTVDQDDSDLLIPKYDMTCTKLVIAASTNGTYSQTVANMANGITAAKAAGRKLAFAMWVYATQPSRVTLKLLDDDTTSTGTAHQGKGWELIWVEATIEGDNNTTLTARLDVSSGAEPMTIYWNRAWLYYGDKERVVDDLYHDESAIRVRRDDTNQHVILDSVPPRGRQVRFAGKAPLTALGSTPSTQLTNAMEVDTKSQEVLVAAAADLLLRWEGMTTDDLPAVYERIKNVQSRYPELRRTWAHLAPRPHLRSPFSR